MTALDRTTPVAVVGTGTMGQGIAHVALLAGHPVFLYDALPGRAAEAAEVISRRLERMVEKGRITPERRDDARGRLIPTGAIGELAGCGLVVEAILEHVEAKQALFRELEESVADDCLLATNTSSLSVTQIAGALRLPGRFVGLHFFNPALLLPLVEVVSGFATDAQAAERAYETALAWGKSPVRCSDTPGFIVNRLARPFYAEAFRLYEERVADPATIDAVLRESGGFKMGPFELTDLIGQDVNEAVTRSVWESFHHDPKFPPSLAQRRLVQSGRLGRKSGQGWFSYGTGAADGKNAADRKPAQPPVPRTEPLCEAPEAVTIRPDLGPAAELTELIREAGIKVNLDDVLEVSPGQGTITLPYGTQLGLVDGSLSTGQVPDDHILFDLALDYRSCTRIALAPGQEVVERDLRYAIGLFQKLGKKVSVIGDASGMIVARTVARLVDLAMDAVAQGVASAEDIDTAMKLGVNYPLGPLEWAEGLGSPWVRDLLEAMHRCHRSDGCYAPSPALHRHAALYEKRSSR
ncbi:3-hydroxyacyl-CoA dehydrogenase [Streptomyces sp. KLOTTS4A1]|uniref:3-hydroxyacyl-CoA dehydrogenase n=1 Tax=Streptomyces sp. KLOTTS4A1 TaxID=3390996 RepID=UPI0039F4FABF